MDERYGKAGKEPKGRWKRCLRSNPYVGGVPTGNDEHVWALREDAAVRVRSGKQLAGDGELLVVAQAGAGPPEPDLFRAEAALPDGHWRAVGAPDTWSGSGARSRDGVAAADRTLQAHPELAGRRSKAAHMRLPRVVVDDGLREAVMSFAGDIAERGGTLYVVGGSVRDALFACDDPRRFTAASPDVDLEVHGIDAAEVAAALSPFGEVHEVGKAYGVLTCHHGVFAGVDVSLPRRERSTGTGHTQFDVQIDPRMGEVEAAARRDFTMNAVMFDAHRGVIVDPYGGVGDIERRRLRHVGERFAEDPLRPLRGAQFAARYRLTCAPETISVCASMLGDAGSLPTARIAGEWRKMLSAAEPGRGLRLLDATGWVSLTPELAVLREVEQDHVHHPEGDVFEHTAQALDALAGRNLPDEDSRRIVELAVLCHDLGKATHTQQHPDGTITAHGHDEAGVEPTRALLARISDTRRFDEPVAQLVRHHMRPLQLHDNGGQVSDGAIRRLASSLAPATITQLAAVVHADRAGRGEASDPSGQVSRWLTDRARRLDVTVAAPTYILNGHDLISRGVPAGPERGRILAEARDAENDGVFSSRSAALAWLDTRLAR